MFIRRRKIPCFRVNQLGTWAWATSSWLSQSLLISSVIISSTAALADVTLTATTPARNAAVATSSPELRLDFTGPVNVATATTDSIRLYRLGTGSVTPGTDDTLVPISAVTPENGGARLRVTTVNPLADGDYAWVVYGSASSRSGAGNDLHFTNNVVSLSLAAFQTLGTNFTWEAWIRLECCTTNGGHGFGAIFDVGQNGRDVPGAILQHNLADWNFYCFRQNGTSSRANAAGSVVLGAWQHICCAASTTGVKLYINGDLAASIPEACDIAAMQSTFQSAISGYTRWAGANDYILGSIDEMRVWNVTRTQAQIRASMNTPLVGNESGLLLYHPLDEGTGNVLTDVTGHGYAGARGNAQWEASAAPMILMAPTALIGGDAIAVDANMDLLPGGVLVSPFRVDTTAPRVIDLTPALDGCAHILYPGSLAFQFDDEMDAATLVALNVTLREAGLDGTIGTGDDVVVPFNSAYVQAMRTLTMTPLSVLTNGAYRLTLSDNIRNSAGISLDGEYPGIGGLESPLPSGNGAAGGSFVLDFRVNTQGDCNENDVPDACEIEANDLNGNGVPDECEDCNENGIVDECDINCGGGGGACNFVGCGQSQDCNGNLIPDECELYTTQRSLDFTNSYVRIPRSSSFEPLQEITIEAWVRPRSNGGVNNRIVRHSASFGAGYILAAGQQTGTVTRFQLQIIAGSQGTVVVADPATLSTYFGQWHHVAGVYSAISNTATLYVDGVQKAQQAAVGTLNYTDSDLFIGNFGSGENFDGQIDEVRIWKVARTQAQISGNMSRVLSDNEPGLVGYWRFDEGSGQQIIDRSSKHNNGQLGNSSGVDTFDPTWVEFGAPFVDMDCNDNGTMDECDVAPGAGGDCDANGVPDECQIGGDYDCDGDGTPEICEPGGFQDCDGDGVPDACEIANCAGDDPACADCNGNGLPDECELVTTPTNLPSGFARNPANGHYYFLTPTAMTWPNAEAYAQSFGGHLATVRDASENSWLVSVFSAQQTGAVHIGFNDIQVEGTWVWASGEPATYTNWAPGEPNSSGNEDWGALSLTTAGALTAGLWNDASVTVRGIVEVIVDPTDCNENGVLDECDIASGTSTDCDDDGTPDECQLGGNYDCDGDGTPEICEPGGFQDCDGDGIPNACEIADGGSDCNANGVPDDCELASQIDLTSDGAVIAKIYGLSPPNPTGGGNPSPEVIRDGVLPPTGTSNSLLQYDTYHNGQQGDEDWIGYTFSSGRGFDRVLFQEGRHYSDGGWFETLTVEVRNAGVWQPVNGLAISPPYPGNNGISFEQFSLTFDRQVGDGIRIIGNPGGGSNFISVGELRVYQDVDCNENGVPDECDIASGTSTDCDENGTPDECQLGGDYDCDNDGTPEICEPGGFQDCNGDGIPDACEIGDTDSDCNQNGVPDSCEFHPPGTSLDFVNDYVIVPQSSSLEPINELTVEAWIRPEGNGPSNSRIVRNLTSGSGYILAANQGGVGPKFQLRVVSASNNTVAANDTVPLSTYFNSWHHVAGVYSATGNYARLYVDGVLKAQVQAFGPLSHPFGPLYIGNSGTTEGFDGQIDEVRIWSTARTTEEINAYMNRGLRGNENNLVGYWKLNEGAGQIVNDASPFGNHGQMGSSTTADNEDPAWYAGGPVLLENDCNENGLLDECDIADGSSTDCNTNGIPDDCETDDDCNSNGILDLCEEGGAADCDGDGVSNWCELAGGATDCDGDGIPDQCEAGAGNHALQFDGANDYVLVPRSVSIEPGVLTLEMWVFVDGVQTRNTRLARKLSNRGFLFALDQDQDAHFQFHTYNGVTVGVEDTVSHSTYVGAWHHFAATYSTTETKLYVNGQLRASTTHNAGPLNYDTQPLYFAAGLPASDTSEHFAGKIDEVRLWNIVRTQVQIEADMHTRFAAPVAGLVGYWKFDEGTGQVVGDSSGFGNHGRRGSNDLPVGDVNDPLWISPFDDTPSPSDCNGNGVPDDCDFVAGTSTDCDDNGIPDECESDCDGNGIVDSCDISSGAAQDCNLNGVPDACDIAQAASIDANSNGVPDDCEPDVRIMPVVTLIDPMASSEIRGALPASLQTVTRGNYYYVEVWASDVGELNTGLSGAYIDVNFCSSTEAIEVGHGTLYTLFPGGTTQSGKVDEFGGSALPGGHGVAPNWVRLGWIKMLATTESSGCSISLTHGAGGVAALGRGLVGNSLVKLGAANVEFEPPFRSYDLDDNGTINVGDLSLFATSWQRRIPPGNLDHDFDCDGFIGASDLSWFATGWLKNVNDPSILYPHCEYDGFIRGFDGQGTDARFRVTVRPSASGSDTVVTLPQSLSSISDGQQFFVEVWASDVGDINTGLTSAYVNLLYPADAAVVSVQHHGVFNVLPSGEIGAGVIESLGGSALTSETAAAPVWVRVASVRMIATASRPVFKFELEQSLQGVAAFSRGSIPWDFVELAAAPIGTPTVGDLDGDGDIDMNDASIFVPVLLGEDSDPGHLQRADLNLDSVADGEDIQDFVNALLSE